MVPEICVHTVKSRTVEQKRAPVRHFQVEPAAVMVQIVESPRHNKANGGVLFSDRPPG